MTGRTLRKTTMRGKAILFLLTLASGQAIFAGEIYRCTSADGTVMYTNIACPSESQVQHVSSYEPAPAGSSAQVEAEAVQAAAISARLAQQAATDARNAAYEASQAGYHGEGEYEHANYNDSDNTLWYPVYPYYGAGYLGLGGGGRPHRPYVDHHGGHADGGKGGRGGHGGGKPGPPKPMPKAAAPRSASLAVRH